ncbi:MAG: hypothetical protein P4L51_08120 [Puia sp.]|nr:hypothetical protein [Puia sp.]
MEQVIFSFSWIFLILCLFLAWYFSNKARYEERKMLIQQGANPDELLKDKGFVFPWLKLGMIVVGLSVGLAIITVLVNTGLAGRSDAIYPAILGLCGGSAVIVSHFVDKRNK